MKPLYHGTTADFDIIDVSHGKGYKDFGKGFYATARKDHAENIAKRNKKIMLAKQEKILARKPMYKKEVYQAYRYNLLFSENMEGLNVKIFNNADVEWIKFILMNRKSKDTCHNYDIVIGPTADEETTAIINRYEPALIKSNYSNKILEQLILELKPENLPKQYFFATKRATDTLKFSNIKREIIL